MRKPRRSTAPPMNQRLADRCRKLVYAAAKKYDIPPVVITAHMRWAQGDKARLEVQRKMISDLGMKRWQVAKVFGRDVRRVRASVLDRERRRYRFNPKLIVEVGNQMVWAFCAPAVSEAKKPRFGLRPIPTKVIESLDLHERAELLQFLDAQRERIIQAAPASDVRRMRKSVL